MGRLILNFGFVFVLLSSVIYFYTNLPHLEKKIEKDEMALVLGEAIFANFLKKIEEKNSLNAFDVMLLLRISRRTDKGDLLNILVNKDNSLLAGSNPLQVFANLELLQSDQKIVKKKHVQEQLVSLQQKNREGRLNSVEIFLSIGALSKAYQMDADESYLNDAQDIAREIRADVRSNEEYSAAIWGLIELYQSDFDFKWYKLAKDLQKEQIEKFWNGKNKVFGAFSKDFFYDTSQPSVNSLAVLNLLRLSGLSYDKAYEEQAAEILNSLATFVESQPDSFAFLLQGLDYLLDNHKEIAIIGDIDSEEVKQMRANLQQPFNPNKVISCGFYDQETNPMPLLKSKSLIRSKNGGAYVCEKMSCKLPTLDYKEARAMSLKPKSYQL